MGIVGSQLPLWPLGPVRAGFLLSEGLPMPRLVPGEDVQASGSSGT